MVFRKSSTPRTASGCVTINGYPFCPTQFSFMTTCLSFIAAAMSFLNGFRTSYTISLRSSPDTKDTCAVPGFGADIFLSFDFDLSDEEHDDNPREFNVRAADPTDNLFMKSRRPLEILQFSEKSSGIVQVYEPIEAFMFELIIFHVEPPSVEYFIVIWETS